MTTDRDFLATPWMVMHSIFDSNSMTDKLIPGFQELNALLTYGSDEGLDEDDVFMPLNNLTDNYENTRAVASTLTMASGRSGQVAGSGDILAEMMCQELLTKSGLRMNFEPVRDNPEIEAAVRELASRVKRMAADFRRNAQGKLIVTATN